LVNPIQTQTNNSEFLARLRILVLGRHLKWTLARAAIWALVCLVAFKMVLLRVTVTGISMLPAYPDHSKNWVNRFAYLGHGPRRGDVVGIRISGGEYSAREIFRDLAHARLEVHRLAGPHAMYLKRIIGLPGETVAFVNGRVLIDDKVLDEPYEKLSCDWNCPPVTLAADEYFVVGDNRSMPQSDHVFGRCRRNQMVGRIL